jgi:DNA-binding NarL/FixJ family response regulator
LEEQHYPLVLVPSVLGFQQPLLMQPDVVILDEPMAQELDGIGNRETRTYISLKPLVLLSADASENVERDWLRPHAVLPVSSSPSEIVQTIYTLAQAEPVEGRQHPAPGPGQFYYLTPPIAAVS